MLRIHSNIALPTTLAVSVDADDTTIVLTSGSTWPSPPDGYEAIGFLGTEMFSYTVRTSNTLTGVVRGIDGTTADVHSSGAIVYHRGSASDVNRFANHAGTVFNIADYGANPADSDNAGSFLDAIAAAVTAGGGIVLVPVGLFKSSQILLKTGVFLRGAAKSGSAIQAISSLNDDLIVLDDVDVCQCGVEDLILDGNSAGNGSAGGGIAFDNTGFSTSEYRAQYVDGVLHVIKNVMVVNCRGDGVAVAGAGLSLLDRVNCHDNYGKGFSVAAADTQLLTCIAGNNGDHGFVFEDGSGNCQGNMLLSYLNGVLTNTAKDGFVIFTGGHRITNSIGQGNHRHGWTIYDNGDGQCKDNMLIGVVADGNNWDESGNGRGFYVSGCRSNLIVGSAYDSMYKSYAIQPYALLLDANARDNHIILQVRNQTAGAIDNGGSPGSANQLEFPNTIEINSYRATQYATYATPYVPSPIFGGTIQMTLTGNITINVPANADRWAGCRMKFILKQDGTGGWTVTWGSGFVMAGWTITATASSTSIVEVEFDGTNWVYIGSDLASHSALTAAHGATGAVMGTTNTQTVENKRNKPRTSTAASGDISPDMTIDVYQRTALAATCTINAPTGTPVLGEELTFLLKSTSTAKTLAMNGTYKAIGSAFPATVSTTKRLVIVAKFDGTDWLTSWGEEA